MKTATDNGAGVIDRPRVTVGETAHETDPVNQPEVAPAKKPPLIPTPEHGVSVKKPLRVRFHVGKDFIRSFDIPQMDKRKAATKVIHLYPTLSEWAGRTLPDNVNPRSHDPECLKSPVARQIEKTLVDQPEDFYLANRGSTIVAESCEFNPHSGDVTLVINDPEDQGLADGATSDAVIAKVQTRIAREMLERPDASFLELAEAGKIPDTLKNARVHLEVFVGLDDRARLAHLVQGRNTSRQVKGWSMADFKGEFEWLKKIIDAEDSPVKGRVGFEENAGKEISVLDILALLTLFHEEFDKRDENKADKAPVIAYANKGRMDVRLADVELRAGYKALSPIVLDILKLHDHVYVGFEKAYESVFGKRSKLARRQGVEPQSAEDPYELPLTGAKSNFILPGGYVFPVLASMRALVKRRNGVGWRVNPFNFFDENGSDLIAQLMEHVEAIGNANEVGKTKLVYNSLFNRAKLALHGEK